MCGCYAYVYECVSVWVCSDQSDKFSSRPFMSTCLSCCQACAYCKETFALILRKYAQNEDFEHNKDQFTKDDVGVKVQCCACIYTMNEFKALFFLPVLFLHLIIDESGPA